MSSIFRLYVIDEAAYPAKGQGSLEDTFRVLTRITLQHGVPLGEFEGSFSQVVECFEQIDNWLGLRRFVCLNLTVNSPHELLDDYDDFGFGYLTPLMAADLLIALGMLESERIKAELDGQSPLLAEVFVGVEYAVREAASRRWAVALIVTD